MKSKVILQEGMSFTGELDGFSITIDADEKSGGSNKGPRPKGLTLTSLAGCTAMDVISILRKMKASPEEFSVEVDADVSDEHPKVFTHIMLTYRFKGGDVTHEKAEKAVHLSETKYCGVSAMLKQSVDIDYEIVIE
jgi:putative redox protein